MTFLSKCAAFSESHGYDSDVLSSSLKEIIWSDALMRDWPFGRVRLYHA